MENIEFNENDVNFQDGQYLTFNLENQQYGIEIRDVTEIVGIQQITDLPDLPDYVKGVINLRGSVIPVVDVRLRFGMSERSYDERTCIMVVDINKTSVGLVVDTVSEVINISNDNIEPTPKLNAKAARNRYVKGLGKSGDDVKIIVDTQKLLFDAELDTIINSIASDA